MSTIKPILVFPFFACIGFCLVFASKPATAAGVGQKMNNIKVLTNKKEPATIPKLGKKPLYIIYVDPDVDDTPEDVITTELKKAHDSGKLDGEKFLGMGIVNMKDTWIPNIAIRAAVKRSIKKREKQGIPFENSPVFVDAEHSLKNGWKLGNCDDVDVVMIIGKDKKLKYIGKIKTRKDAKNISQKIIKALITAGAVPTKK
ncbi:MAG: hypothetical protein GY847_24840 [Proteobacteria bacterium]|nr:hypothetical protein [Pseudomonadota bacterium]